MLDLNLNLLSPMESRPTEPSAEPESVSITFVGGSSLHPGDTKQFAAGVLPASADQTVTWSISYGQADHALSPTGLLTAGSELGWVGIRATASNGISRVSYVQVLAVAVTGITISGSTDDLVLGQTRQLSCTVEPSNANQGVVWSIVSGDATISTGGLVTTGDQPGNVEVKVTSSGDTSKSATLSFATVRPQPVSVTITPQDQEADTETTIQYTAVVEPPLADQTVVWDFSYGKKDHTLSQSGLLTLGKTEGWTTVRATAVNGVYGRSHARASVPEVSSVTISGGSDSLINGLQRQFEVTVLPASANQTITWSVESGDATIDQNGLLTSVGVGTVVVKALSPSGVFGTITFEVVPANQAPIVIKSLGTQTANDGDTISIDLNEYFQDPEGGSLSYSASGLPSGISIAQNLMTGELRSNASSNGVDGSYSIAVTARDNQSAIRSQTLTLNVSNPKPVISHSAIQHLTQGQPAGTRVTTISCQDDDSVSYSVVGDAGNTFVISSSGVVTAKRTITADDVGTFTGVTILALDADGASTLLTLPGISVSPAVVKKWTPNYVGTSQRLTIPDWTPASDGYVTLKISIPSGTRQTNISLFAAELFGTGHVHATIKTDGSLILRECTLDQVNGNAPSADPRLYGGRSYTLRFRVNAGKEIKHFGYKPSKDHHFKGQMHSIHLNDPSDPLNERYYKCIVESVGMPNSQTADEVLSGHTGNLVNFGTTQPWVELIEG